MESRCSCHKPWTVSSNERNPLKEKYDSDNSGALSAWLQDEGVEGLAPRLHIQAFLDLKLREVRTSKEL